MKYKFEEIFKENEDKTLSPKKRIRVGDVIFSPEVKFSDGVSFNGIDIYKFKGHDIEAKINYDGNKDILIITGIY